MNDQETAIVDPSQIDFSSLLGQATSQQSQNFITLPRLALISADNQKWIQKGGVVGEWALIASDDSVETLGTMIEFWSLGYIGGRTVWPYDPKTGKGNQADKTPWCGANNDDAPRKQYKGKVLFDWRDKVEVTITDTCHKCPLKEWRYEDETDHKGNPILNSEGKPKQKRLAPICSETPNMLWYVKGIGPVLFQARNTTTNIYVRGVTKGKYGKINGLNHYFMNDSTPLINAEKRQMKWLQAHPHTDTTGQKPVIVPKFTPAPEAMPPDEMIAVNTAVNRCKAEGWIDIMRQERTSFEEEVEEHENSESQDTPQAPW